MRLAVLGDPVAHSRSPAIHTAALAATGIEGSYEARRVDAAGFAAAMEDLRRGRLDGANVTMPHKAAAATAATRVTTVVSRARMANTLARREGEIEAENTDVGGLQTVADEAGIPGDAPMLVLGAGGAASAALLAFEDRLLMVSARRAEAAGALADRIGVGVAAIPWGRAVSGAVVVNATPLGMEGESLPHGILDGAAGLIDMAYGPRPTPAVLEASGRGIPVADGLDHLIAQAALSFTWWTGVPAPVPDMRSAARAH